MSYLVGHRRKKSKILTFDASNFMWELFPRCLFAFIDRRDQTASGWFASNGVHAPTKFPRRFLMTLNFDVKFIGIPGAPWNEDGVQVLGLHTGDNLFAIQSTIWFFHRHLSIGFLGDGFQEKRGGIILMTVGWWCYRRREGFGGKLINWEGVVVIGFGQDVGWKTNNSRVINGLITFVLRSKKEIKSKQSKNNEEANQGLSSRRQTMNKIKKSRQSQGSFFVFRDDKKADEDFKELIKRKQNTTKNKKQKKWNKLWYAKSW